MRKATFPSICFTSFIAFATIAPAQQTASPRQIERSATMRQGSPWWLDIKVKAQSILVDPATCEKHDVMDPQEQAGILSPSSKQVAFIASDPERVKAGHEFDLFVADVDPNQPSGKANIRTLTTDQERPTNAHWLSDGTGIAFQAGGESPSEVWYVALAPVSQPVRISDEGKRSLHLSVTPAGEIAWVQIDRTEGKHQFADLNAQKPRAANQTEEFRRILLHDQFISSYAFDPDGKTLAWSEPGSMHIVDLESGASREIPCHGIHRQLINHMAHDLAWSPDGRLIAARFGFAGGISRGPDADPNAPWPRMFAADKVFFIPADWTPTADSLKVGEGEGYPSPTADDPKAEVSPPAGDQSKPWWVRELTERALAIRWINAPEAQSRIAGADK